VREKANKASKEITNKYGMILQDVLTMDDHCLDNTSTAYNSTIIFFKKAVEYKNVQMSNRCEEERSGPSASPSSHRRELPGARGGRGQGAGGGCAINRGNFRSYLRYGAGLSSLLYLETVSRAKT